MSIRRHDEFEWLSRRLKSLGGSGERCTARGTARADLRQMRDDVVTGDIGIAGSRQRDSDLAPRADLDLMNACGGYAEPAGEYFQRRDLVAVGHGPGEEDLPFTLAQYLVREGQDPQPQPLVVHA